MPAFLQKSSKQHSTEAANAFRLVTKVRWVVESANGRIKTWKYLDNVVHNRQVPFIDDYIRIVSSIINKDRTPIKPTDANDINTGF